MFLRNAWYAAGFSDEFGRSLLARTFLNEAVVIFRAQDGKAVAFEDRCAHRRLPLSMGRLIGDQVECGYHGLVYDCSGGCVKIPGQPAKSIPPTAKVRTYPVVDRHFYLWIWMGDPTRADPRLIPDYSLIGAPGGDRHRIKLHVLCNYQLIIDNLLDLSHLPYVHSTTTGSPPLSENAVVKTVRTGNTVHVKRWVRDVVPSPTFAQFGRYKGRVNLWQVSEYSPPSYVRVGYGSSDASLPLGEDDDIWRRGAWGFNVLHGITPETDTTTHQFRYVAYTPNFGDAAVMAEFNRQNDQIITEDRDIFAVQQRALNTDYRGFSAQELHSNVAIHADGGLLAARRILEQCLKEECETTGSTTPAVRQSA
jgi:vanillate monooxygenase